MREPLSRGIELSKLLRFSNTNQGYKALEDWMQEIMKEKGKNRAIVGFEPTGHYWLRLVITCREKAID
jgi:transposase